jgi:hypothetical protein
MGKNRVFPLSFKQSSLLSLAFISMLGSLYGAGLDDPLFPNQDNFYINSDKKTEKREANEAASREESDPILGFFNSSQKDGKREDNETVNREEPKESDPILGVIDSPPKKEANQDQASKQPWWEVVLNFLNVPYLTDKKVLAADPRVTGGTEANSFPPAPGPGDREVNSFPPYEQPPDTPIRTERKYPYPIPQRMSLRDTQKKGIGYPKGYLSLDGLFGPDYVPGRFLPMADIRGHRFDDDNYAANVGFVGRYIAKERCRIYGVNAYYDWRNGCLKDYHQLGLGMEVLGKRWDFRFNGYIPFGAKERTKRCLFEFDNGYRAIFKQEEYIFQGFNAEVGALAVRLRNFLLYGAAGPYYLSTRGKTAWGARARIRPQFRDWAALEFSCSQDHIFHTIFQLQLIFSIPIYEFYPRDHVSKHPCLTDRQIYQPVERFEIIPTQCKCRWETNF